MVRRATPDDYDAIFRLSEGLYDGYVCIPDTYFKCLEDPNRFNKIEQECHPGLIWQVDNEAIGLSKVQHF